MTDAMFEQDKQVIMACRLFAGLQEAEVCRLLRSPECAVTSHAGGSVIAADDMLILLEGSLSIEKAASDGRRLIMRTALPPQPINVCAGFGESAASGTLLRTTQGCRVLRLPAACVRLMLLEGGLFGINILSFLAGRVQFLNQKIVSLAGYTAESRILMFLRDNAVTTSEGRFVELPHSLTEFAELLGIGRASLYRSLDAMEASGKLKRIGRHKIQLTMTDEENGS